MSGGPSGNLANPEFARAIIVDSVGPTLKSPESIKKMVEEARAAGFNTIIAQVRSLGDAYYKSSIVPMAPGLPDGFDPLATLLQEAKSGDRPLKVHAMLVTYRVWAVGSPRELPDDHVAKRHPDWLTQTFEGSNETGDGREQWLDPGLPEVQEHLAQIAVELTKNYAVDGIILDRLRYPDVSLKAGYAPASVELFNATSGKSGKPAIEDPAWVAWRRDQVTAALRKVRDAVKGAKPEVAVGVDSITFGAAPATREVFSRGSDAYARALQDWAGWCADGLVDVNVLMAYKRADRNAADYEQWMNFATANKGKSKVIVAVGAWLNEPRNTAGMMLLPVLNADADGVAVSSYHSPSNSAESNAAAFQMMARVLDPAYVASRKAEIEAAMQPVISAEARLGALAAAAAGTAVATPTATTLAAGEQLPPLAAVSTAPPLLPALGTATMEPLPSAQPAASAAVPVAFGSSQMSLPTLAEAAAPTPSLRVPATLVATPRGPDTDYVPDRIPGMTNYGLTARVPDDKFYPRPFVAPKVEPPAVGGLDNRPAPLAEPRQVKLDFSDPESLYVPKEQTQQRGLTDYVPRHGRSQISESVPLPGQSDLEVIVLSTGKQFAGRVLEKADNYVIQLHNGGTITLPASRVVEVRPLPAAGGGGQ